MRELNPGKLLLSDQGYWQKYCRGHTGLGSGIAQIGFRVQERRLPFSADRSVRSYEAVGFQMLAHVHIMLFRAEDNLFGNGSCRQIRQALRCPKRKSEILVRQIRGERSSPLIADLPAQNS